MAQAVEHLLCKHKTLNSNPSPTKTKLNKKERKKTEKDLNSNGVIKQSHPT
jgi:hypothetical protein